MRHFGHPNDVRQQVADQDDDKSRQRYALNRFTEQVQRPEMQQYPKKPPSPPAIVR